MSRKSCLLILLVPCLASAQPGTPAVRLTMRRAIEMAAARGLNPSIEIAQQSERIAEARYAQGHAAMWPIFDITTTGQNLTRNLNAQGFRFDTSVPGLTIPRTVGPFNTLDARVTVTQPVFDLSAFRRSRAARASIQTAKAETTQTRDEVAAQVAHAYARVLREEAGVAAAEAAIERARATLQTSRNKHDAGTGIAIDVTRAEYQVSREQQSLIAAKGERERAVLALLDAMGLSFDTRLEFEDSLRLFPPEPFSGTEAVRAALRTRGDLEAQRSREENLRLSAEAVRLERLPTVAAYADAGALGGAETHTIGVALRIPIFDGGRRKTREEETEAMLRQETARESQLKRKVELQIRQAEAALRTTAEQVTVSESYVALAEAELAQARRRHDAGVTGALDVIEAQAHVAAAARDRVEALYRYTEARIDAQYAVGTIRDLQL
jgi:outer membrane protein TolC